MSEISGPLLLEQIRDYADCANAAYAFLHLVDEKESPSWIYQKSPIWIYADGIRLGYKIVEACITDLSKDNKRQIGEPTAYAMAIESVFSENFEFHRLKIDDSDKKEEDEHDFIEMKGDADKEEYKYESVAIEGDPHVFISRYKEKKDTAKDNKQEKPKQYLRIRAEYIQEKQANPQDLFGYHYLSLHTKAFVSRYELIHHQKNTSTGLSYTIFKDTTKQDDTYVLAFRGTEPSFVDLFADLTMATPIGMGLEQIINLATHNENIIKIITDHRIKQGMSADKAKDFSIDVVGHSLGGHLAQAFCLFKVGRYVKKLYTYNAPGFGGLIFYLISLMLRLARVILKLIIKGIGIFFGFIGGIVKKCINFIIDNIGSKSSPEECSKNLEDLGKQISQDRLNECVANCKKAAKNKLDIEAHHVEAIGNESLVTNEDGASRELATLGEFSLSATSNLGFKIGVDTSEQISYKNTSNLHYIYIDKLGIDAHSMTTLAKFLHFYTYLIENSPNQDNDIISIIKHLNKYSLILKRVFLPRIENSERKDKETFYMFGFMQEIARIVKNLNIPDILNATITYPNQDFKSLDVVGGYINDDGSAELAFKYNVVNIIIALIAAKVKVYIIDDKKILDNNAYNFWYISKALPFMVVYEKSNEDGTSAQEIKLVQDKSDIIKAYSYNLSECKYINDDMYQDDFFDARLKQVNDLLFGNTCHSMYIYKKFFYKASLTTLDSTMYVDYDRECIYIFAIGGDFFDCDEILKQYADIFSHTEEKKIEILNKISSFQKYVFFYGYPILGTKELKNTPFHFANTINDTYDIDDKDTSKPYYIFQANDNTYDKGTLTITYYDTKLVLFNYSLLESSFNIKLECINRQTIDYINKVKANKTKNNNIDKLNKSQSKSIYHALLENAIITCEHSGIVKLKSSKGKYFKSDNIPLMLQSDFINSSIIGCKKSIGPCTCVAKIDGALSKKKFNGESAVLQELIYSCLTNNSSKLIHTNPIPNKFKIENTVVNHKDGVGDNKEHLQEFKQPMLRLHYKSSKEQRDNVLINKFYINDKLVYKNNKQEFFNDFEIIIDKHCKEVPNKRNLVPKDYYKQNKICECKLKFGNDTIHFIFIIPYNIPKVFNKAYQSCECKDYGIGFFKKLDSYSKDLHDTHGNIYIRYFMCPAKATKICIKFAKNQDEYLEKENHIYDFVIVYDKKGVVCKNELHRNFRG